MLIEQHKECKCAPKPFPYDLQTNPEYLHYPSCLSIDQCSGCCTNKPNYECKPTAIEEKTVNVARFDFRGKISSF